MSMAPFARCSSGFFLSFFLKLLPLDRRWEFYTGILHGRDYSQSLGRASNPRPTALSAPGLQGSTIFNRCERSVALTRLSYRGAVFLTLVRVLFPTSYFKAILELNNLTSIQSHKLFLHEELRPPSASYGKISRLVRFQRSN
jgi:hypothetical protein